MPFIKSCLIDMTVTECMVEVIQYFKSTMRFLQTHVSDGDSRLVHYITTNSELDRKEQCALTDIRVQTATSCPSIAQIPQQETELSSRSNFASEIQLQSLKASLYYRSDRLPLHWDS